MPAAPGPRSVVAARVRSRANRYSAGLRKRIRQNTIVPRSWPTGCASFFHGGENRMRMFFGIIIGFALAVGGAYVADTMAGPGARPMVNWDVVAKNIETLTAIARDGWKKIAG